MRKGYRQSDERWNCFKGNVNETSERLGEVRVGFSECINTIMNLTNKGFQGLGNGRVFAPIVPKVMMS